MTALFIRLGPAEFKGRSLSCSLGRDRDNLLDVEMFIPVSFHLWPSRCLNRGQVFNRIVTLTDQPTQRNGMILKRENKREAKDRGT